MESQPGQSPRRQSGHNDGGDPRAVILKRLSEEGRDPETLIRLARRKEGVQLTADLIADVAVPGGSLPEDHPDYLTDHDPWSVAWDAADELLHPEREVPDA